MRRARVDLDLRRQLRLLERLLQDGLVIGRALIVVRGDRDEELRPGRRGLQVRTRIEPSLAFGPFAAT